MASLRCVSPVDGRVVAERPLLDGDDLDAALARSRRAQCEWARAPLAERSARCLAMVDAFEARGDAIAEELTWQMGRPLAHSPGEVRGFAERARGMVSLAAEALADHVLPERPGSHRFIRREPHGVVLTVAPWNYPYLTAVNSVVPALVAGNAVLLRHSAQTPLCAERMAEAFEAAGLPDGLLQAIHCGHEATAALVGRGVDHVVFTGSVAAGRRVEEAALGRFIGVGLELGGKDPGYVRADADLEAAADGLVDGAYYNAGQSCCGIERIYVERSRYADFVDAARERVAAYVLGNPLEPETTLGPMVNAAAADAVRAQVAQALARGARSLVKASAFGGDQPGSPYCVPRLLVDVEPGMGVMREESFGPVVGIQAVDGDDEALRLMNDSPYGLTASVWTRDRDAAVALGVGLEAGTVFMNRCDYLDPELAWTGVTDSGRGCSLSRYGYDALTRPKSFLLMEAAT